MRADALEENVICRLFECFGNPKAMERAIAAAIPNPKKVLELQETAERLAESQIKIKEGREKILRLVVKGSIKEEAAQAQLEDLNRDEESNATKLNAIAEQLKFIPSAQSAKVIADAVTKQFKFQSAAKRWAISNQPFAKMSWDDKRELAQTVFGGLLPDGRRMGVYISWDAAYNGAPAKRVASDPNRPWRFSLLGQVINQEGLLPETSEALHHNEFGPGTKRTTKSALC